MTYVTRNPEIQIIELQPIRHAGELAVAEHLPKFTPKRQSFWRRHWLFIALVFAPMLATVIYFGWVRSNMYAVTTSYVVRSVSSSLTGSSLSMLGNVQNFVRSEEDTLAVNSYLQSRDALRQSESLVKRTLSRSHVDIFHNLDGPFFRGTHEALFQAYRNLVHIKSDENGIAVMEVRAYEPRDAQDLAERLLKLGEDLVNRMNQRAMADLLRASEIAVKEAEAKFQVEQQRLTAFRNREMIVDPQREATASLELMKQLAVRKLQDEASLAQMLALSPNSPQIAPIRIRIGAIQSQIDAERERLVGSNKSSVGKLAEFEQLLLRREFAARALGASLVSLETDRQTAQKQQFYLETIVRPVLPDEAKYPFRLAYIGAVFVLSLLVFWIVRKSVQLIAEHKE